MLFKRLDDSFYIIGSMEVVVVGGELGGYFIDLIDSLEGYCCFVVCYLVGWVESCLV